MQSIRKLAAAALPPVLARPIRRVVARVQRNQEDAAGFRTSGNYGVRIAIDPDIVSPAILKSISSGGYENSEAESVLTLIGRDDRVLELGAGLGFIASVVNLRCHPLTYCAVEADLRLIPLIHSTLKLNGIANVDVRNAVLTNDPDKLRRGNVPFLVNTDFWVSRESDGCIGIDVPVLSLNAVLRETQATILIADIEGGEVSLFDEADLSLVQAVCLELHPDIIGDRGVHSIIGSLHGQGFVYDCRSDHYVIVFRRPASRWACAARCGADLR